jgi:hypothetical protein
MVIYTGSRKISVDQASLLWTGFFLRERAIYDKAKVNDFVCKEQQRYG